MAICLRRIHLNHNEGTFKSFWVLKDEYGPSGKYWIWDWNSEQMTGLNTEYSFNARAHVLLISRAHYGAQQMRNHKMLGSSTRWLQGEVEDEGARKERKEMMTMQRLNLKAALASSTSCLKALLLPLKFTSLQLGECRHQQDLTQ